ncbi:MAG: FlgD immunoglobulin-like domain containing protein, partial [candidate division WOR-3 bacterium]
VATAVKVDNDGSVFVTGYSLGEGTDDDYITIKYSPKGGVCWVRRYNGPANGLDQAFAIAVDQQGNAYVTGGVRISLPHTAACLTIKYNPDGDTAWTAAYSAPAGKVVYGQAVIVDSRGCVYVAGIYDYDILTIKYVQGGGVEEQRTLDGRKLTFAAKPNPFKGLTAISIPLSAQGRTKVGIFDVSGRVVKTLVDGLLPAGVYSFVWDGTDINGRRAPAGVYMILVSTQGAIKTTKVTVIE